MVALLPLNVRKPGATIALLAAAVALVANAALAQVASPPASAPAPTLTMPDDSATTTTAPTLLPPAMTTSAPANPEPTTLKKVVVSSKLDQVREDIAPSLGAVTYSIGPDQILNTPRGENASFQQVLLRAPGVVLDSFGQEHVRGEHGNLTYRVNGVILPQPLSGFGQELDTHMISSVSLIDGSLPAQFGLHTAGIVDVTTKSGASLQSNSISIYAGSFDTLNSSFQFGGTSKDGRLDYFVTGSTNHSDLGIENPTSDHRAIHDYTDQQKFFGYFAYTIDDTSRITFLVNASNADFQIPNTANLPQQFALAGHPVFASDKLNENQNEQSYYAVLAYQKTINDLSFQISGFTSYGQINFRPDPAGDLIFQGVAGRVFNNYQTNGLQFDASYILNEHHTLRAGVIADRTVEKLNTNTLVFPTAPLTDIPLTIEDNSGNTAIEAGIYLQDEWRITENLTMNAGLRYDRFDATFDHEGQLSPRANLVWKIDDKTTAHVGYSRYFVTPPVQNVGPNSIAKFTNTTNAPGMLLDTPPKAERSNYYDVGISRQITPPLQLTLDGFYKTSRSLIDEGQFGAPVIESPFNYNKGTVYGAELSATYKQGGLSLFANLSWVRTTATQVSSQQYLFAADEFAYIQNHNIHLDHESEYTVSAGASYAWEHDRVYLDFLFGSGLRSGFANTSKLEPYYPVNIGYEHIFPLDGTYGKAVKFRVDVVNVLDEKYEIRDGSGIGVGAPQFGERRGFFAGLTYEW